VPKIDQQEAGVAALKMGLLWTAAEMGVVQSELISLFGHPTVRNN
jgi:hypothetical protein